MRSLIEERDSCRTSDPNDPRVKFLDDLVQRGIRQEAQHQWQSLLNRSDRRTSPTGYWALLRKLSGKRAPQPPNISISFGGLPLSGAKSIAGAFTKQFTAVAMTGGVRPTPAPGGGMLHPDRTRRRLLRHIHRDHPVDHDFRPFSVRDVEREIREASQSTAGGPDGLTVVDLKHLGVSGRAFLTELFNLSLGGIDLPSIWKSSTIIPILKPGKPRTEGASYRPISLLCPAVKILERPLLPFLTEALDTRVSQHWL